MALLSLNVFAASGTEPMYWSSFMTSSMQLAKECLSQKLTDDIGETFQPFEGLEKFAETIETGIVNITEGNILKGLLG